MYVLGLCDNGNTYVYLSKIILIMIVILINNNDIIVHVFWIFNFCYYKIALGILSHLHVMYSAQWYLKNYIILITYYLFYDNGFTSRLSNYLNYCTALVCVHHQLMYVVCYIYALY